jgi:hypothetical protein
MFRGPPRLDHLIALGAERPAIGPAMFDAKHHDAIRSQRATGS